MDQILLWPAHLGHMESPRLCVHLSSCSGGRYDDAKLDMSAESTWSPCKVERAIALAALNC